MKWRQQLPKILPWLLYATASLVLILFLGKNTSAYEAHLIDVRNSAGPPLAVGADAPGFRMEDTDGKLLESSKLPEKSVLIVGSAGCPHFRDAMRAYNAAGNYQGISDLYAVYAETPSEDVRKTAAEAAKEFENLRICLDDENSVKWAFRCEFHPTTFVLENGKVVSKEVGFHGEVTETGKDE